MQHIIRKENHHTVSVGISELCTEMQMLPQAYERAKCCTNQKFLGSESVLRYSQLKHCHTLDAKCGFMTGVLHELAKELHYQRTESRKNGSVAYQVRQLVDNEFGSNAMSLEYVATKVHKSPAYISKVFKNT